VLVPAVTLHAAITGLAAVGVDADALRAASGLTAAQLQAPFAMAPVTALDAVWARAASLDRRPELVLRAARALPLGAIRLLDTLAVSAPTLAASLDDAIRFFRLASVTLCLDVHRPDGALGDVAVEIRTAEPFPRLHASEAWALGVVLSRLRAGVPDLSLTGAILPPRIARDRTGAAEALGLPPERLSTSSTHSGFSFAVHHLDTPVRTADPGLYALIASTAEQIMRDAYERSPLTFAIRCALPEALATGVFALPDMARRLGLSARSLQRHLRIERTSFRAVLDEHRRDIACRRLCAPHVSIGDVAAEVGYTDPAVFSRTFQRWFGMSPSAWRRAQTG
jgi:AraC-like DNA-binding protein